ncbi:MAG: hypothetical protein ACYC8T_21150 [Myxococcaceae bacterium]
MMLQPARPMLVALAALLSASAWAAQSRYVGGHPIAGSAGGGYCYIEPPHVHYYAPPESQTLFRDHDGFAFFIGDPVRFGYEGPKFEYRGPHPVSVELALGGRSAPAHSEVCFLEGAHFHVYEPPPGASYSFKAGTFLFTGTFPETYARDKERLGRINLLYYPATAPAAPAAAQVEVELPAPTLELRFGVPGNVVLVPPVPQVKTPKSHSGHGHHGDGRKHKEREGRDDD